MRWRAKQTQPPLNASATNLMAGITYSTVLSGVPVARGAVRYE